MEGVLLLRPYPPMIFRILLLYMNQHLRPYKTVKGAQIYLCLLDTLWILVGSILIMKVTHLCGVAHLCGVTHSWGVTHLRVVCQHISKWNLIICLSFESSWLFMKDAKKVKTNWYRKKQIVAKLWNPSVAAVNQR